MCFTAFTDSWQSILAGSRQLRWRIKHARRFHTDRSAINVVYEHIAIDGMQQPPGIATNVYRFNGSSWHMVLHHASPATDIGKENETEEKTAGDAVLH